MNETNETPKDFVDVAIQLGYFTRELGQQIRIAAEQQSQPAELLAMQRGKFSSQDLDIIESLRRPRESLPGYEILGLLGRGGMGVVYRARQITLNREVALKTILVGNEDQNSIARFEQEAQLAARLQHPNIISIYDFGRRDNRVFTAMELVEGEDAEQYLNRRGPMPEQLAWGVIRQAAAGLAHAAAAGIIHRDIKPANLLFVQPPDGYDWPADLPMVKIADFGLASLTSHEKSATRLTQEGSTLGSPHYMAPEQLQAADVDAQADIYSLGATAFHLLTGIPPFSELSLSQIVAKKFGPPPDPNRHRNLSAESAEMIAKLMQAEKSQRVADYRQLLAELPEPNSKSKPSTSTANSITLAGTVEMDVVAQPTQTEIPAEEIPVEAAPPKSKRNPLALWSAIILALLLFAAATVGVMFWAASSPVEKNAPKPVFEIGDYFADLFNGRDLTDWRVMSGVWRVGKNDDGARILVGENGIIARELLVENRPNAAPLRTYRLTFLSNLTSAKAVELKFGIERSDSESPDSYVVRIQPNNAALLFRDATTETVITEAPLSENNKHFISLEQGAGHWWIAIDKKEFAFAPQRRTQQFPEFRLEAIEGEVEISDVTVIELVEP